MKLKDLFKMVFVTLFVASIMSCNDDEKDINDFEIPILTADNTVQFNVKSSTSGQFASYIRIYGVGRFAVDWGDGIVRKVADSENQSIVHYYKESGSFNVKIWSEELTSLGVEKAQDSTRSGLQVGDCPRMKYLTLHDFSTTSLDITDCPNLEILDLGGFSDLAQLDVSKCPKLQRLEISAQTKLSSLDLSNNKELDYLRLFTDEFKVLDLKENTALKSLMFVGTQLSSIDLTAMENLTEMVLHNTALTSFDATLFPALTSFFAKGNQFNTLDFSGSKNITELACYENELEHLIISDHSSIKLLACHSNKLEADVLNTLFERLPISKIPASKMTGPPPALPSIIMFYDNPGVEACDVDIIKDKGWKIIEKEIEEEQ